MKDIEFLSGNHKFWENTRKRMGLGKGPVLGGAIVELDMATINLTDMHTYCEVTSQLFEKILYKTITHEFIHLTIAMEGIKVEPWQEEYIIDKITPVKPINFDKYQKKVKEGLITKRGN